MYCGVYSTIYCTKSNQQHGGGSVFCNFLFLQGRKTLAVKGASKLEDARFALLRSFPVAQDVTNAL